MVAVIVVGKSRIRKNEMNSSLLGFVHQSIQLNLHLRAGLSSPDFFHCSHVYDHYWNPQAVVSVSPAMYFWDAGCERFLVSTCWRRMRLPEDASITVASKVSVFAWQMAWRQMGTGGPWWMVHHGTSSCPRWSAITSVAICQFLIRLMFWGVSVSVLGLLVGEVLTFYSLRLLSTLEASFKSLSGECSVMIAVNLAWCWNVDRRGHLESRLTWHGK